MERVITNFLHLYNFTVLQELLRKAIDVKFIFWKIAWRVLEGFIVQWATPTLLPTVKMKLRFRFV